MTSKKSAKSKRTHPPRDFTSTKEFTKETVKLFTKKIIVHENHEQKISLTN